MASGYLRISNDNIRRKSLDSSTSDFNAYVISLITPIKVHFNSQQQPVKVENNFFDKLIYLDKGTYHASDGSTYAERILDFPVAMSCTNAGYNIFKGTPFINAAGDNITPSIEFMYGEESEPVQVGTGFVVTYKTMELYLKFEVSSA